MLCIFKMPVLRNWTIRAAGAGEPLTMMGRLSRAAGTFESSLQTPVFPYLSSMPIFFECQRCTACCRWPGQVRLADEEIRRLAAFEFIQQFTRVRPDRRGLALMDQPDGACIFLEGAGCAVQPVKPQQCRDFPNLWNFPGFEKVCHALPREVDDAEYARRIARIRLTGSAKT